MWEGIAGQMLGSAIGTQDLSKAMGCGVAYPYSHGNFIPLSATTATSHDLYIGNNTEVNGNTCLGYKAMSVVESKVEEPPDEFTQLSNHKFHELLDRFSKLT